MSSWANFHLLSAEEQERAVKEAMKTLQQESIESLILKNLFTRESPFGVPFVDFDAPKQTCTATVDYEFALKWERVEFESGKFKTWDYTGAKYKIIDGECERVPLESEKRALVIHE